MENNFDIIVISPNKFNIKSIHEMIKIPDDKTTIENSNKMSFIDTNKFLEAIKQYLIIITTNKDDLLEKLVENLNMNPKQLADTDTCISDKNNIIQITYITDYNTTHGELDNFIASYLTEERHGISGNGIIVKTFHNGYNSPLICTSVDYMDVINMLVTTQYKDGVKLNINNTLEPILYDNDLNIVNNIFEKQYSILGLNNDIINLYGFDFKIYFDSNNTNDKELNKYGSHLLNRKVYGDMYCLGMRDNNYENLNVTDLNDLLQLPYLGKEENMEAYKSIGYYKMDDGKVTLKNKYDLLYENLKIIK
jgi:hypothetical protein